MAKKEDFKPRNAADADVVLGARIRDLRTAVGMSQQALGDELGVSFQQIQKHEKGMNRVSAVRLKEIADVFEITPSDFFWVVQGCKSSPPDTLSRPSDDALVESVQQDR